MAKPVESVFYNDGKDENVFAIVAKDVGDTKFDLIVFDPEGGQSSLYKAVPRREKADYGPEGGGRTWHS